MNPFIKKQFLLEAWDYNQSLAIPLQAGYQARTEYYSKYNNIIFKPNLKDFDKQSQGIEKVSLYQNIIEREIKDEISNQNHRKLDLVTDDSFLVPYFKHFFTSHPDIQIDLLKFFNHFLSYKYNPFDFLKEIDKKEALGFLVQIDKWSSYASESLENLEELMSFHQINEGMRASIFKKYIEKNLKIINKQPGLSNDLEQFLDRHYPYAIDIIAPNVVAIKNRQNEVDTEHYMKAFNQKPRFSLVENIDVEKLLKTFQIAGWTHFSYNSLIHTYHMHLKNKYHFDIQENISTNQKEMQVFISMPQEGYTLEHYKEALLVLFKFFRAHPNQPIGNDVLDTIFLKEKMQENFKHSPATKTRTNKI